MPGAVPLTPTLRQLNTKLLSTFNAILEPNGEVTDLNELVDELPVTSFISTFAWLALMPQWRKWLGERVVQSLKTRSWQIQHESYESTVGIDRDDLDDNAFIASLDRVAAGMGEEAGNTMRQSVIDVLVNGTSIASYDGQSFFDTDHPTVLDGPAGSQQNYFASGRPLKAAGADPWANLKHIRKTMWGFRRESGRPFRAGMVPANQRLIVPLALAQEASDLMTLEHMPDGSGGAVANPMTNAAKILVAPELDVAGLTTTWFWADVGGIARPVIRQRRKAPAIQIKNDPKDENAFWFKEAIVGGDMKFASGPGFWHKIIRAAA